MVDSQGVMTVHVRVEGVAWRRSGAPHHYVGTLTAGDGSLRLSGRDAATGIEVALAIPVSQVRGLHLSAAGEETVLGQPAVVLDLAGSRPICLRELRAVDAGRLARRLEALVGAPPPAQAAAAR